VSAEKLDANQMAIHPLETGLLRRQTEKTNRKTGVTPRRTEYIDKGSVHRATAARTAGGENSTQPLSVFSV